MTQDVVALLFFYKAEHDSEQGRLGLHGLFVMVDCAWTVVCRARLNRFLLVAFGDWTRGGSVPMNQIESQRCAQTLEEIRAHLSDNLDSDVLGKLDDVIARLEQAEGADDLADRLRDGLEILGQIVEVTVGIANLFNLFNN
jgi:hypothetical protein